MSTLVMSMLAVGAVSLLSLIGILTLYLKETRVRKTLFIVVSLAAGALLGDAFIHLIPEALHDVEDTLLVSLALMGGTVAFFILEKYLRWHHSHGDVEYSQEHAHIHPLGHLVLSSDILHNLVDGLAIGAAFLVSPEIGIATTLAIALHEIPQEVADFGLLLHAGFSRGRALFVNFLSALSAFAGLGIALFLGEAHELFVPLMMAFTAGGFIYIALADLVPELQKTVGGKRSALQLIALLVGVLIMVLLLGLEGEAHGHADDAHDEERTLQSEPKEMHEELPTKPLHE